MDKEGVGCPLSGLSDRSSRPSHCLIQVGGRLLVNLSRHSTMLSLIPGLSWFSRSSEKERGDTTHTRSRKGRRRTLSEPMPMDADSKEGSRPKCSVCNGICIHWAPEDTIARSYPDTAPIFYYQRGKPYFEYVRGCYCGESQ